jgi:hypothetical protein
MNYHLVRSSDRVGQTEGLSMKNVSPVLAILFATCAPICAQTANTLFAFALRQQLVV